MRTNSSRLPTDEADLAAAQQVIEDLRDHLTRLFRSNQMRRKATWMDDMPASIEDIYNRNNALKGTKALATHYPEAPANDRKLDERLPRAADRQSAFTGQLRITFDEAWASDELDGLDFAEVSGLKDNIARLEQDLVQSKQASADSARVVRKQDADYAALLAQSKLFKEEIACRDRGVAPPIAPLPSVLDSIERDRIGELCMAQIRQMHTTMPDSSTSFLNFGQSTAPKSGSAVLHGGQPAGQGLTIPTAPPLSEIHPELMDVDSDHDFESDADDVPVAQPLAPPRKSALKITPPTPLAAPSYSQATGTLKRSAGATVPPEPFTKASKSQLEAMTPLQAAIYRAQQARPHTGLGPCQGEDGQEVLMASRGEGDYIVTTIRDAMFKLHAAHLAEKGEADAWIHKMPTSVDDIFERLQLLDAKIAARMAKKPDYEFKYIVLAPMSRTMEVKLPRRLRQVMDTGVVGTIVVIEPFVLPHAYAKQSTAPTVTAQDAPSSLRG
eukprot:gene24869-biopygen19287